MRVLFRSGVIALGKNADEPLALHDGEGADVFLRQEFNGIKNGGVGGNGPHRGTFVVQECADGCVAYHADKPLMPHNRPHAKRKVWGLKSGVCGSCGYDGGSVGRPWPDVCDVEPGT